MNAKEWIEKFGTDHEVMCDMLQDRACPECGSRDELHIEISGVVLMSDTGLDLDDFQGDYDRDSLTRCGNCERYGELRAFSIPGLDDALEEAHEREEREAGERDEEERRRNEVADADPTSANVLTPPPPPKPTPPPTSGWDTAGIQ